MFLNLCPFFSLFDGKFQSNQDNSTPRTAAGIRRRQAAQKAANNVQGSNRPPTQPGSMMKMYSDDSPGIKVDPVVVLVGSLTFIASVFILHIVGKYLR
jgi:protein transport protein SEC61 subunit beta